jgi:hypothetical protein
MAAAFAGSGDYRPGGGSGGSGTPGGSDTQVQFNDGGAFGADAGLVYDKTNDILSPGAFVVGGGVMPLDSTIGLALIGGTLAGTSRIIFRHATDTAKTWEVDNDDGTFRWFNPGVVRMSLTTAGALTTLGGVTAGGAITGTGISGTSLTISGNASNPLATITATGDTNVLYIKGASGQTGRLTEWQNNSGTALATVQASGVMTAPNLPVSKNVNTTAVGNVGTGEDDLITYSLTAATLANAGDAVEVTAFGTFAGNSNAKQVKLKFGATTLLATGSSALLNGGAWQITARILRTGAATQIATAGFNGNVSVVTTTATYTEPTETLSGAITIKCTGEATANNDVIQKGLMVRYLPNL